MKPEKDDRLFTPGPTKYSVEIKSDKPKWTISGTKRRSYTKKPKTPGCGKYEYKTFIGEGPKYSFGPVFRSQKTDKKSKKFEVPGPGFYSPRELDTGPKYSMYARNHDSTKNLLKNKIFKSEVPGVGKYELRKDNYFDVPCYKFDKSERNNLTINETSLQYPGPNKYTIDFQANCTTSPSWSFGQEERFAYNKKKNKNLVRIEVPGPGAYKTRVFMGKEGPFYTFNKIKDSHIVIDYDELKKLKEFPSVGKYLSSIRYLSDLPFYTFSNIKNKLETSDKGRISSPGPGNYNPNKEISSTLPKGPQWSWSLSRVNRDEDAKVEGSKKIHIKTPGPGYYENKIGKIPQGPQYTMSKLLKKIKIIDFPGPDEYNIATDIKTGGPEYSISKEKKCDDLKQVLKDNYPGPGSYQIKDVELVKCFTISKSEKKEKRKSSIPGPGAYRIPSSFDYINNMTRDRGAFDPRFRYI